ncbi:MAG TPA: GatB/YqeY domain-containing protein [Actinomycetota bacterium]|nr:GatB/YqeY domain-containing protein [Actinomycetota bacterium]
MPLKETLQSDLHNAIKSRDELTTATLRMALAAVTNAEVAGKQAKELSDDEVLAVLDKEAKKRRESAQAYRDANRPELADREEAELGVLTAYLPTPLSADEVSAIIDQAIAEVAADGRSGMAAMGPVMQRVTAATKGRADGKTISGIVRQRLQG